MKITDEQIRASLTDLLRRNADTSDTLEGVLTNEHVAAISQAIINLDARWQGKPKARSAK